nr:ymf67 [Pseudocohnilembus persalinus]
MCMLIVWYCLISAIYFLLNVVEYLFVRLFKFDKSFFNLFSNTIYSFLNSHELLKTNINSNNVNSLNFKELYQEYSFFSNKGKVNNLRNHLVLFNLSKVSLNNSYNTNFSFLVYINSSSTSNIKKINLNKVFSNLSIRNSNHSHVSSKVYLNYKLLSNVIYRNFVTVSESVESSIVKVWNIKYAPSNFLKYINLENLAQYNVLYLRKHKVFNKGRYSRNRQYYRTGVYWCLYVNIIAVIGIYFWFYRFTMNFGYLWWLLFAFIASFIVPKTVKYRLYNPLTLVNSLINDLIWVTSILVNLLNGFLSLYRKYFLIDIINTGFLKSVFKAFLLFSNSSKNSYIWEYSNANYYVLGSVNSQPYWLQKVKIQLSAFVSSVTNF